MDEYGGLDGMIIKLVLLNVDTTSPFDGIDGCPKRFISHFRPSLAKKNIYIYNYLFIFEFFRL